MSPTCFGVAPSVTQISERPEHRVSVFEVAQAEFNSGLVAVMNHGYLRGNTHQHHHQYILRKMSNFCMFMGLLLFTFTITSNCLSFPPMSEPDSAHLVEELHIKFLLMAGESQEQFANLQLSFNCNCPATINKLMAIS